MCPRSSTADEDPPPRRSFYNTAGEWDVENKGVAPDIEVEMSVKSVAAVAVPNWKKPWRRPWKQQNRRGQAPCPGLPIRSAITGRAARAPAGWPRARRRRGRPFRRRRSAAGRSPSGRPVFQDSGQPGVLPDGRAAFPFVDIVEEPVKPAVSPDFEIVILRSRMSKRTATKSGLPQTASAFLDSSIPLTTGPSGCTSEEIRVPGHDAVEQAEILGLGQPMAARMGARSPPAPPAGVCSAGFGGASSMTPARTQ